MPVGFVAHVGVPYPTFIKSPAETLIVVLVAFHIHSLGPDGEALMTATLFGSVFSLRPMVHGSVLAAPTD